MVKKINKKKNIEEVVANSCLGKRPKGPSGVHNGTDPFVH